MSLSPPSPYASPQALVAVLAVVVALAAHGALRYLWTGMPPLWVLAGRLLRQCRSDLATRTRTAHWVVVLGWGGFVAALHYDWLAHSLYVAVPWLDLVSHSMSGAGVAGVLLLGLREEFPRGLTGWSLLALVLVVGAGFEVYEFLFKSFWHHWTLQTYAVDTVVDLGVNVFGAGLVVSLDSTLALQRVPSRRAS